jgi:hypothetical protein
MNFDSVLIVDKNRPDCVMIDWRKHIAESLGKPMLLPSCFNSDSKDYLEDIVKLCELIAGEKNMKVYTVHSPYDSNLSSEIQLDIIHSDKGDPFWERDTFILVNGDNLYSLADDTVGDSCILDWIVGWWGNPIADKYDAREVDTFNDRIGSGYSSEPYWHMVEMLYNPPIWSERRQAFLGRFKGSRFPVMLTPCGPFYGG